MGKRTKLAALVELVEKLTKQLVGVTGTQLVKQLTKLRHPTRLVGLANLAGLAKLVNQLTKLRHPTRLVGLANLA